MPEGLVAEQLKNLPADPGVYLMKDAVGGILYVGKAVNLRNRVRSYFAGGQKFDPKTARLVKRVRDIDFFITATEQEALILEMNLIKSHRPRYNVRLKDDKSFPYLKIDVGQEWPRVCVTRRLDENGGRYFGPFASARSMRRALKIIKEIFPFRDCSKPITGRDKRPCLDYYIHHCLGPCIGAVSKEEYAAMIKQIILFLEGRQERVVRELETRMKRASAALDYERAAVLRDRIQAVKEVIEGQRIATAVRGEQDVIAFAQEANRACVQVFFIRGGKLVGREGFVLEGTRDETPPRIIASFLEQFYSSAPHVPPLLLLQHPVDEKATIEIWLGGKRGSRVRIQVPRRGNRKRLVDIVAENARRGLEQLKIRQLSVPKALENALDELAEKLDLPRVPERIEGYDISNIQGQMAVGSMVVFEHGKAKPAHYRRFQIKTVAGADDYAMMREVLGRRFRRQGVDAGGSWAVMPDLILIDGGKGQLNAALAAMSQAGVSSVPVIGLAKENEEIFTPGGAAPIALDHSSPALQLLQRVRDEAHRFALSYHLKRRHKQGMASALDAVPGIGPARRRALIRQFGSVRGVREASLEELEAIKGITGDVARNIKLYL